MAAISATYTAATRTAAQRWYAGQLVQDRDAREYLAGRGISVELAGRLGIGYAPRQWTGLVDHLRAAGHSDRALLDAGLALPTSRRTLVDRFRARVMVPVADDTGRLVGFTGRTTPAAAPDAPRYLDSPTGADYRKGLHVHGLWQGRRLLADGAVPVIAEGVFDAHAVTLASRGRFVGLAPSGTALTVEQVAALDRVVPLAGRPVVVAFDGDQAGRDAALAAWPLLRDRGAFPYAAELPDGLDPAALAQVDPDRLREVLTSAPPLEDRVVDRVLARHEPRRWAEDTVGAIRDATRAVATMAPARVGRQVARIAVRLEVPATEVTAALVDAAAPEPEADRPPVRYLEPDTLSELPGLQRGGRSLPYGR